MPLLRVSDKLHDSREARLAGLAAMGMWLRAASWSLSYTPGFIPTVLVRSLGTHWQAKRLVKVGLWEAIPEGYNMAHRGVLWEVGALEWGRPAIPTSLRRAVYDRDGWACLHCGAETNLSLDHIYPYSLGGPDTLENLQTLCRPCNSRKGAKVSWTG